MNYSKIRLISTILLPLLMLSSCQEEQYQQGKKLYEFHCQNCHMEDGSGLRGNIPPLAQADYLKNNQDILACIITRGQSDTIIVNGQEYTAPMLPIKELSEFQLANVINYINHAWGNNYGFVTVEEVKSQLDGCK